MIIAVDSGKYTTKAMDTNRTAFSIRTLISDRSMILSKSYQLDYDGKRYYIGDGAADFNSWKSQLIHKLCALVAISQLGYSSVDLIIGCPVSQFANKEARAAHAEYFKGCSILRINDSPTTICINSVMALPETLGVVMSNVEAYSKSIIGVIDIGGLNTNALIYDHMKPVMESAFTVNEGGLVLNAKIKRELNMKYGANYQDYEIPHLHDKPIINNILNEQMERIVQECRAYNWNIDDLPVIFTGGGSLRLEEQIKQHNWSISKNPIWDNVQGFLKFKEAFRQ